MCGASPTTTARSSGGRFRSRDRRRRPHRRLLRALPLLRSLGAVVSDIVPHPEYLHPRTLHESTRPWLHQKLDELLDHYEAGAPLWIVWEGGMVGQEELKIRFVIMDYV